MSSGCGRGEDWEDDDEAGKCNNAGGDSCGGKPKGCTSTSACSSGQGGSWNRAESCMKDGAASTAVPTLQGRQCMKCRTSKAVILARQREPLCGACLELSVLSKVRGLKHQKLLLSNDSVALALSGGSCSLALLLALLELRSENTQRMERGKVAFKLTLLHVNESAAHGQGPEVAAAHAAALREAVARCGAEGLHLEVVSLEHIFPHEQQQQQQQCSGRSEGVEAVGRAPGAGSVGGCGHDPVDAAGAADAGGRRARLQALLQAVPDATGREDLVRHLRSALLTRSAARLGASKLLLGDSATAMAIRIISDTAKGRGYSLPADIQALDAREAPHGPVVLYPLREVSGKELAFWCRHRGVQPAELPLQRRAAQPSINQLASAFVEGLQASLPSTIYTVLRAASNLQPFPWNALGHEGGIGSSSRGGAGVAGNGSPLAGTGDGGAVAAGGGAGSCLCRLCRAPLTGAKAAACLAAGMSNVRVGDSVHGGGDGDSREGPPAAAAGPGVGSPQFCTSCLQQVLYIPGQRVTPGAELASPVVALLPFAVLAPPVVDTRGGEDG